MRTAFLLCLALLFFGHSAAPPAADEEIPPGPSRGAELVLLEKRLHGTWKGPACGGDATFRPDGTYELKHFTPGNNTLTGTWSIRWNALPPTLIVTCRTSDFQTKDPTREEYAFLGRPREAKLLELDRETLAYRFDGATSETRFERPDAK